MLELAKKSVGSREITPMSQCLLICVSGCKSGAIAQCKCSKKRSKAKSYGSKYNSFHLYMLGPDGG